MKNRIRANKKLNEVVNRIGKFYKPEKVILFGSAAKGHYHKGSDFDLLIIKNTNVNPWDRILEVEKNIEHHIPLDMLIYTQKEINERLKLNDFFIMEIMEEGRVLYERKHNKNSAGMARKGRKRPSICRS